jgi:hypothetical protein
MAGSSIVGGARIVAAVGVAAALAACSGGSSPAPGPTTTVAPTPTTSTSSQPVVAKGLAGCLVGTGRQTKAVGTFYISPSLLPLRQVEGGRNSFTYTFRANGTWTSVDPRHEPAERIQGPHGVLLVTSTGHAHGRWAVHGNRVRLFASKAHLPYRYVYKGRVLNSGTLTHTNMTISAVCGTHQLSYNILGQAHGATFTWHGTRV